MQSQPTSDINLLWGALILEELARLGVKHVCMAPGSRSTPLTLAAAAQSSLQSHLHFDERGLGFMALGLAKASHSPVAIITTSGTAVANLYPAIIEAWLTQVPLIILTGDRPPELIGCGANQAINQPAIFADYAKQVNLPTPDLAISPNTLLTTIDEAVANLTQPVHVNCMYREPLYPTELQSLGQLAQSMSDYVTPITPWLNHSHPYTDYGQLAQTNLPSQDTMMRFAHGKGIIVAGTLSPQENPKQIIELSQKLGWPIVADAQSQLRQHPSVIGHIDQLLLNPKASKFIEQADRILVFGGRFISKRLISFIANHQWHSYWQVLANQQRLDPNHQSKRIWQASITAMCNNNWPRSSAANWALSLVEHNQNIEALLTQHIDQSSFGEPQVVRHIAQQHSASHQWFIGNSLPIRLYDMYAPIICELPDIYTNRGASGIDGLIATATGVALANNQPTTLLIGDISSLHDLNSLAMTKHVNSPFVIVILNNDGGNIFNLLPVPNDAVREQYYRLSHGLEFGYAAAMFGLAYNQVDSLTSFNEAYADAMGYAGTSVIEVNVSPTQASDQIKLIGQWVRQH
ncbi:2-succinyl-5-enolpyruvyl-6-hydroxy-3-cyclohexene-1-carboxylic-acid synthase [Shewanella sp. 6_MG-2023]|uniref:2-succinyl-5-enolpyruvyl-6-hydroxy-3- cyclohexene-1-carboxylic-acid synthase n=1 Tax=Shewanella sp. 6_MG-2023 TaxID=3062660 RepID=UPI0026E41E21|nr:2-succinyl-5-enolpyruvyl-6-hydroxy-3-cyclohexene-1-carboxylic-acid synthase [Shewanella sp. 6_MG-2023]MDO6618418.1 2-succinyl-5-enolpyruvyl-6-hydroxy-3-cyclohexene-1-carboxylic-acid synthase [Shewanella sp. 6_MG-2023]